MIAPVTTAVLIVTALATLYAFMRPGIAERWIFDPRAILVNKEYHRMITSGLIHADWFHFAFNAFSFYAFARNIEFVYGPWTLLLIYAASILGGSCLSLIIHRNHEYRALGASGGVCGVIYASIFLLPGGYIRMFFVPIDIPPFVYAVLFLAGSFVAHRRGIGNVGHDAHMGGAIVGLLTATALYPKLILAAPVMFATVLGLSLVILWLLVFHPWHRLNLRLEGREEASVAEREREYRENNERNQKLAELDALLDQVSRRGMSALSGAERQRLEQLSKEVYGRK